MSKGENKIILLLNKSKIEFQREKTFPDLKRNLLRFDFYLPYVSGGPAIIEYDGEQHFQFVARFYKTRQEWMRAREHDRRKNSYCLANGIKLYRIPYWEIDNIKEASDLFQKKFLVKDRWHNDNLIMPV